MAQVQANLIHLSLAAQMRYYTGFRSIEPSNSAQCNNTKSTKKVNPTVKPKMKKIAFEIKYTANFMENVTIQPLNAKQFKNIMMIINIIKLK
jgi:hypothetical protein